MGDDYLKDDNDDLTIYDAREIGFDDFQEHCAKTDVGTSAQDSLKPGWMYYVLGIGGETGELLEKIKKVFRDDYGKLTDKRKKAVIAEMGDIMWYMARICDVLGIPFSSVAWNNIKKLQSRKDRNQLHGDGDER